MRSFLRLTLVAGAVAVAAPAFALDDGQQSPLDTILGILSVKKDSGGGGDIDYRERAPIVLPPKMELRQPKQAEAGRPASWPKDPDVMERKRLAAKAREPKGGTAKEQDLLAKDELLKGRTASGSPATPGADCGAEGNQKWCLYVRPDLLASQKQEGVGDRHITPVGQEPEREWLTEPPKGYRLKTKDVAAGQRAPDISIDDSHPLSSLIKRVPAPE